MSTFNVAHPAFPLPTTASPTLQRALKMSLERLLVACGMPEPCELPSLGSCQQRCLWTHKRIDRRWQDVETQELVNHSSTSAVCFVCLDWLLGRSSQSRLLSRHLETSPLRQLSLYTRRLPELTTPRVTVFEVGSGVCLT